MSKRKRITRAFLTPASPDGKKGEVIERQVVLNAAEPMYMAPVPYWEKDTTAANDASDNEGLPAVISPANLDALLSEFSTLMRGLSTMRDEAQISKAKQRLEEIRHLLDRIRDGIIDEGDHERRAAERGPQTSVSSNNTLMAKLAEIRANMRSIIEQPART